MTASFKFTLTTPDSIIKSSGTLRSPEHYSVVACAHAGKLVDDHNLLKAAPDLYKALEELLLAVRDIRGIDIDEYRPEEFKAADAAIAKAKGEK